MDDKAFVDLDKYIKLLEIEKEFNEMNKEYKKFLEFLREYNYNDLLIEFEKWKGREKKSTLVDLAKEFKKQKD